MAGQTHTMSRHAHGNSVAGNASAAKTPAKNSAADNSSAAGKKPAKVAETQAAANAGRQRQSHQQYQSRVMNPSVSGDGWSDEERHERRETVGSKCDTAEGEGGWWREQPPHCDSAFMQVSCGFHPGAGVRFHLLRWDPTRSARGPALRPVNRRKTLQPVKHAQPP